MRHLGLHTYRFKDNPEEERIAKAWVRANETGNLLAYLLDTRQIHTGCPADGTDREEAVAATAIQWLGSPVGQAWLQDLGYVRKEEVECPPKKQKKTTRTR